MKKKLLLPADLKSYASKMFLKRLISFVVIEALFAVVLIFFGKSIFGIIESRAAVIACYVITLLVPFFITGFPLKLIMDSTIYGVVESIDVVAAMAAVEYSPDEMVACDNLVLHIGNYDGKKIKRTVKRSSSGIHIAHREMQRDDHLHARYEVGDTVFHLYGTKKFIKIGDKTRNTIDCIVCECANDDTSDNCRKCGYSLIKESNIQVV